MKPLIAVAGIYRDHNPDSAFIFKECFVNEAYTSQIEKAGGIPYILPYGKIENIEEALEPFSALLVPGGYDVNPAFYGEEIREGTVPPHPYMDEYQLTLIKKAHEMGKWVFGICRGFQGINVSQGGTLYQHIASDKGSDLEHLRKDKPYEGVHKVKIEKDSHLYKMYGKDEIEVNSLHHQGIKNTGKGLKETAYAPDGLVEAIEGDKILAVQWHPEALSSPFFDYIISLLKSD